MKSLRSKLTASILAVCLPMIFIMWLTTAYFFRPMYYQTTQNELSEILNKAATAIENNDNVLNEDVIDEISSYIKFGICIEIANEAGSGLVLLEGIGDACQLHGASDTSADAYYINHRRLNTQKALDLRSAVRATKNYSGTITDEYNNEQAVRALYLNNSYTIIVSTNLSRTDSIIAIVLNQIKTTTIFVITIALIIAAAVASWFLRPITALSGATKQIAKGNYDVKLTVNEGAAEEIQQVTQDFNTMIEEIKSSQLMQKDLIASISHDLRTPLTIIKGYAEGIKDITGDNKTIRDQQLTTIIDETDRLSLMVGSVLEYAKLNQSAYKLNRVQYDIVEMCQDVVDVYSHKASMEGKTVRYEGIETAFIFADPGLIERVIHNFVSNALIHTKDNTEIIVKVTLFENKVKVSVIDSGDGIPQEEIKHIFEKYYRARKDTGRQGTGLGLAIVKSILDNHGFDYGVNSTLGKGSEFWFTI